MFKHLLLSTTIATIMASPVFAQYVFDEAPATTSAQTGTQAQVTNQVAAPSGAWLDAAPGGSAPNSPANYTAHQTQTTSTQGANSPNGPKQLPVARTATLSKGGGLPPTMLDSFVQNAGGAAFQIYGDEGTDGPPPLDDFSYIGDGMSGITTGHASGLPSAWGYPQ